MTIRSYRDLEVWQWSMDVVTAVYRLTESFPTQEVFGLTSQMRRSAVSIPSNISEGSRRGSRRDFRQFVLIAYASGAELETQLEISTRLGYATEPEQSAIAQKHESVMKMLNMLARSLSDNPTNHSPQPTHHA